MSPILTGFPLLLALCHIYASVIKSLYIWTPRSLFTIIPFLSFSYHSFPRLLLCHPDFTLLLSLFFFFLFCLPLFNQFSVFNPHSFTHVFVLPHAATRPSSIYSIELLPYSSELSAQLWHFTNQILENPLH